MLPPAMHRLLDDAIAAGYEVRRSGNLTRIAKGHRSTGTLRGVNVYSTPRGQLLVSDVKLLGIGGKEHATPAAIRSLLGIA